MREWMRELHWRIAWKNFVDPWSYQRSIIVAVIIGIRQKSVYYRTTYRSPVIDEQVEDVRCSIGRRRQQEA